MSAPAAVRQLVSVYSVDGTQTSSVALPNVFTTPIRTDIVQFVHTQLAKNGRQPYAVDKMAGHQTSARSWGTGRAVSRIPRVRGGGTHRSGQGAFGNMCRGGRMFGATKIWRKWHRKVNLNQRRFAISSALAASAVSALVAARGHRIGSLKHVPIVFDDASLKGVAKTRQAVAALKAVGAYCDVERVIGSKTIRCGKGKMRNRRYRQKLGPLIITGDACTLGRAARNLPGVEIANVRKLNILRLAPGGQVGRFCIWTSSAFAALDSLYGAASTKKRYSVPRAVISNPDIDRIIQSDEVQSACRRIKLKGQFTPIKRNALKNKTTMHKLNPYYKTHLKLAARKLSDKVRKERRARGVKAVARRGEFYKSLTTDILRGDAL